MMTCLKDLFPLKTYNDEALNNFINMFLHIMCIKYRYYSQVQILTPLKRLNCDY